jgi:uncharacterized protein (TIGR02266 family)
VAEKKTILVISHSAANRMFLGLLMKRMWHFPILAATTMECVQICENNAIDLILLDGNLPENELRSAVRLLRGPKLGSGSVPLAVFLAAGDESLSQSLMADGCSAVLTRPIDFSFAYGLVNRIIDQFRTTPRIPLKVRVEIRERTPDRFLTSVNVSEGGIYLRTLDPLPEGVVLHLVFSLPHDDEAIQLPAEVVRTFFLDDRVENEPGMGLRFLVVPDAVRVKLRNYVQWEMMGDLEWDPQLAAF